MKRKAAFWLVGYFFLISAALGFAAFKTIRVDPFFHFHKPNTDEYFYALNNQRSQNPGIVKHFDYTGLITGTSMIENFKTTEAEELWGGSFIKTAFSGGSYKEINDIVEAALRYHPTVSIVIRGLDMSKFLENKDEMRDDLGSYPTYLYDDNIFNDVQYVFNRDVVFRRVYPMTKAKDDPGFVPGITTFDDYSNWMQGYRFGKNTLFPEGISAIEAGAPVHLSEADAETVRGQIEQNITALAERYPAVTFCFFFPPYSAQWWMEQLANGQIYRQLEAERLIIEALLRYPNVRLFSFNCRFELTTDLNHYKDATHYGEWINRFMLRCMREDRYRLTAENYQAYLEEELRFYTSYDYTQMNEQPDYEDDDYAAFLLAKEAYGLEGRELDPADEQLELQNAELVDDQHEGKRGILCTGRLQRDYRVSEITAADYVRDTEFVGFKMIVRDISPYQFITFYGKKVTNHGQPTVYIYNKDGKLVAHCSDSCYKINEEWKQYVIDVTDLSGEVSIIFNGGYVDSSGSPDSKYVFSDIIFY